MQILALLFRLLSSPVGRWAIGGLSLAALAFGAGLAYAGQVVTIPPTVR